MQKDYSIRQMPTAQLAVSQFMTKVYMWMTVGILLTAAISVGIASDEYLMNYIATTPFLFFGCILLELGLVVWLSARIHTMEPAVATGMFLLYAALNGVTLSVISLAYTQESIQSAFITSSFAFGGLSIFGYVTKRDLGPVGSFCTMGLFGLVGFALLALFFPGMMTSYTSKVYGIVGIIVFAGLTAYDTQKIKNMAPTDERDAQRGAIMGALKLYLDFINLFLFILRMMSKRR